MIWRVLADVVVGVHYAFLLYLLVGGFLAWRWPRTLALHVAAAVWAVLIVTTHVACPLTWLQNEFRSQDGLPAVQGGFIDTYVKGTLYPAHLELLAQAIVAVAVLGSWVGLAVRHRHRTTGHPVGVARG